MYNWRRGIGLGVRYNTNAGRVFGLEFHTFGINSGMKNGLIYPRLHWHYSEFDVWSIKNHLRWYTPFKLGYTNTKSLVLYGMGGRGFKKTETYKIMWG